MMRAENRADTIKWKKKRKNHFGDRCKNSKCPICARHKSIGNSKKLDKKKQALDRNKGFELE